MKKMLGLIVITTMLTQLLGGIGAKAQTIDTLIDVGQYKLHFHIVKGKGTPILFDAGGGETAAVWKEILPHIAHITGTTLITYDRAGFGSSTFSTQWHGILNGIIGLETALHKLGYSRGLLLVAHSQGGIYAKLYAHRHPQQVKGAVLIDISSSCWFTAKRLAALQEDIAIEKQKHKATFPGLYYQLEDLAANFNYVRDKPFPMTFPIIDLVSGHPPFTDSTEIVDWRNCHTDFVKQSPNRTGITAYGSGHYIYKDNPPLIISVIAKMYAQTLPPKYRERVMANAFSYMIDALNRGVK